MIPKNEAYRDDLIRPSVWLNIENPQFFPLFSEYWNEHIEGFTKSKRRKNDKDLNMEWRVRLKEKESKNIKNVKVNTNVNNTSEVSKTNEIQKQQVIQNYRRLKKLKKPMLKNNMDNRIVGPG